MLSQCCDQEKQDPIGKFGGGSLQMWNQILQKYHKLINGGMQMEDKYKQLKINLETFDSNSLSGSLQSQSFYYFKTLSQISMDTILEQNEVKQLITKINELKNKIEFMKSRFGALSVKYAQKKRKQQQKRLIHCEQQDCKEAFLKERQLHYHKLFTHQDENLFNNAVFSFRVEEDSME